MTVLINNYNYARYLDYCIESVLSQTYHDIEVILYDDGSTDDSLAVARKYEDRITIIAEPNYGHGSCFNQSNAINRAFKISKGYIICLLDSDDAFLPQKIYKVVKEFNRDESIVLVQHMLQYINDKNKIIKPFRKEIFININHNNAIYFTKRLDNLFMSTSALSFRRSYLEKVLPLTVDKYDKLFADVKLTRQAIFYGNIKTINESIGQYRIHIDSHQVNYANSKYLKDHTIQLYEYFNLAAINNGFEPIKYSSNMLWDIKTKFRLLVYIIIYKDRFRHKVKMIINLTRRVGQKLLLILKR